MADKSTIQWTNASWTPTRARVRPDAVEIATAKGYGSLVQILTATKKDGALRVPPGKTGPHCEHASPGCLNCYSETNNGRCLPANGTGLPFDRRARDLVEMFVDENILLQPLKWRAPRKVFVCSQTDLFAEFVTDEMIDRVFAVMALCPQPTFQILTKRSDRMRDYLSNRETRARVQDVIAYPHPYSDEASKLFDNWPLRNVHLGVSVENQEYADKRIPDLLATPAAVRWVSYEPALGPVDWEWPDSSNKAEMCCGGHECGCQGMPTNPPLVYYLDWCVVGGESGPGARPFNVAWARNTIRQWKRWNKPVFLKQLGAKPVGPCPRCEGRGTIITWEDGQPGGAECPEYCYGDKSRPVKFKDRKGGDMDEWPEDLRVRQFPGAAL